MPTTQFACGMFAVGKCKDCGAGSCGIHGSLGSNGRFRCSACEQGRASAARESEAQKALAEIDSAPVPTAELLASIIRGDTRVSVLQAGLRLSGAALAGLLRGTVPTEGVNLHELDETATKRERKKQRLPGLKVWKTEQGWVLNANRSWDAPQVVLLADGRQLFLTFDADGFFRERRHVAPGAPVDADLVMPFLRGRFPAFREIRWV